MGRSCLRHGGAETTTNNQEESEAICLLREEGRQVLGVENQEHNCSPKVTRGEETEGKPDCSEGGLEKENVSLRKDVEEANAALARQKMEVAILREKMARFEAGIYTQPGSK